MFWWIFQNFVIAGLLAGLVQVASRLGRIGPVGRHALWLIVLVKLVTPPLVVLYWPWPTPVLQLELTSALLEETIPPSNAATQRVISVLQGERAAGDAGDRDAPTFPERAVSTATVENGSVTNLPASHLPASGRLSPGAVAVRSSVGSWRSGVSRSLVTLLRGGLLHSARICFDVWLIGGLAFALIQSVRIARVVRRLRTADSADESLSEQVGTLARRLRIMHPIPICVVPKLTSPLIWCVNPLRPQLLWPAELPPDISEDCQRGLIVHELAHVRRGDHWVGWLELAAGCAWWWNPLFWYVRSQLRENAELACDGWVINELPHGRRAYAEALIAVCAATARSNGPMPAVGVSTGGRAVLERRLAMIMRERVPLRLSRVGLLSLIVLTFAILPAWAQRSAGPSFSSGDQRVQNALPPEDRESVDATARAGIGRALSVDLSLRPEVGVVARNVAPVQTVVAPQPGPDGGVIPTEFSGSWSLATRHGFGAFSTHTGHLTTYRDRVGQTLSLKLTGSVEGAVWGSDVYTDDSQLGAAAVHAGILKPGETGVVRVMMLPGRPRYEGSARNGIASADYGSWEGSYRFEPGVAAVIPPDAMARGQAALNQTQQPIIVVPQVPAGAGATVSLTLGDAINASMGRTLPTASLTPSDAIRAAMARTQQVSMVSNAYWDLVYATEVVESARQSLALATKLVEENTLRVEAATLAPLDVVSARAAQAQRQQALNAAEGSRRTSELVLKRLIVGGADDPNWMATLDPIDRELPPELIDVQAIDRARSRIGSIEPQVMSDINQSASALAFAAFSVRSAQSLRELSQQRLKDEQRKFDAGTSTNYLVVQAQRDLNDARLSELRAMLSYRKAQVEVERVQETALSNPNIPGR